MAMNTPSIIILLIFSQINNSLSAFPTLLHHLKKNEIIAELFNQKYTAHIESKFKVMRISIQLTLNIHF